MLSTLCYEPCSAFLFCLSVNSKRNYQLIMRNASGSGGGGGGGDGLRGLDGAPTAAHLLRLLFTCAPTSVETATYAVALPTLEALGPKPCGVGFAPRVADGVGSQAYKR